MTSDADMVGSSVCQKSSLEWVAVASVLSLYLYKHLLSPQTWLELCEA